MSSCLPVQAECDLCSLAQSHPRDFQKISKLWNQSPRLQINKNAYIDYQAYTPELCRVRYAKVQDRVGHLESVSKDLSVLDQTNNFHARVEDIYLRVATDLPSLEQPSDDRGEEEDLPLDVFGFEQGQESSATFNPKQITQYAARFDQILLKVDPYAKAPNDEFLTPATSSALEKMVKEISPDVVESGESTSEEDDEREDGQGDESYWKHQRNQCRKGIEPATQIIKANQIARDQLFQQTLQQAANSPGPVLFEVSISSFSTPSRLPVLDTISSNCQCFYLPSTSLAILIDVLSHSNVIALEYRAIPAPKESNRISLYLPSHDSALAIWLVCVSADSVIPPQAHLLDRPTPSTSCLDLFRMQPMYHGLNLQSTPKKNSSTCEYCVLVCSPGFLTHSKFIHLLLDHLSPSCSSDLIAARFAYLTPFQTQSCRHPDLSSTHIPLPAHTQVLVLGFGGPLGSCRTIHSFVRNRLPLPFNTPPNLFCSHTPDQAIKQFYYWFGRRKSRPSLPTPQTINRPYYNVIYPAATHCTMQFSALASTSLPRLLEDLLDRQFRLVRIALVHQDKPVVRIRVSRAFAAKHARAFPGVEQVHDHKPSSDPTELSSTFAAQQHLSSFPRRRWHPTSVPSSSAYTADETSWQTYVVLLPSLADLRTVLELSGVLLVGIHVVPRTTQFALVIRSVNLPPRLNTSSCVVYSGAQAHRNVRILFEPNALRCVGGTHALFQSLSSSLTCFCSCRLEPSFPSDPDQALFFSSTQSYQTVIHCAPQFVGLICKALSHRQFCLQRAHTHLSSGQVELLVSHNDVVRTSLDAMAPWLHEQTCAVPRTWAAAQQAVAEFELNEKTTPSEKSLKGKPKPKHQQWWSAAILWGITDARQHTFLLGKAVEAVVHEEERQPRSKCCLAGVWKGSAHIVANRLGMHQTSFASDEQALVLVFETAKYAGDGLVSKRVDPLREKVSRITTTHGKKRALQMTRLCFVE